MTPEEHAAYNKGYSRGRKTRSQTAAEMAFWERAYLAVLGPIVDSNWHSTKADGTKTPLVTAKDRSGIAQDFADEAVRRRRMR